MSVELQKVTLDEKPVLAQLLQLFLHDLSEFVQVDTRPDGRFAYRWFEAYFIEWNRQPFFIRVDGQLAGFVLVRERIGCEEWNFQIAEFFIMRGYRKKGIGTDAALKVLELYPGKWGVSFDYSNLPATQFWKSIAARFDQVELLEDPIAGNRGTYMLTV